MKLIIALFLLIILTVFVSLCNLLCCRNEKLTRISFIVDPVINQGIGSPTPDKMLEIKYNKQLQDTCSHQYLISMGDGIGTCIVCGKGIIYDNKLFERPLYIYGGDSLNEKQ